MARWLAALAVLAGVALVAWALFGRETDEERILGQLDRLERAIHTDAETGNNPIVRGAALRGEFVDLFEKDVRYRIAELTSGEQGRESLVQLAVRTTTALTLLDVDFGGVTVEIAGGGTIATVRTQARIKAFRGSEPYEEGERRVRFSFTKDDGEWKIDRVEVSDRSD